MQAANIKSAEISAEEQTADKGLQDEKARHRSKDIAQRQLWVDLGLGEGFGNIWGALRTSGKALACFRKASGKIWVCL